MSHTRSHQQIEDEIKDAEKHVMVGGVYSHYKNTDNLYVVENIAVDEITEKLCVVYRAEYGKKPLFVRSLESWLEVVDVNGKKVERFRLVAE